MENEHTKFSTHSYRNTTKKFSYFFVFDFIYKIFISLHLRHSIIWPLTTIFNVGQKNRYRSLVYIRFKDSYSIKSWASQVAQCKESACQSRRRKVEPWAQKIPWRRKWQPTPVFLPGESHG